MPIEADDQTPPAADPAAADPASPPAPASGDPAAPDPAATDGDGAPWYGNLAADNGSASSLSDADWMQNKGYADLQSMVKAHRALESKLATKGIEVPGEDATPEQRAAFAKAIGVPENPGDYEIKVPEGFEPEAAVITPLAAKAHAMGIPKAAFEGLASEYLQLQIDQDNAAAAAADQEREATFAKWGAQKDQNVALFQRGMEALDIDKETALKMQKVAGAAKLLEAGLKAGQMSGEDGFIGGQPKNFGIDAGAARTELTALENDRAVIAKFAAKDPATVARIERLRAVIAADDAAKARAAAA